MDDLDAAIELAEARTGIHRPGAALRACADDGANLTMRKWTSAEEDYLKANYRRLTEEMIAEHLHRSVQSVHLHIYRELHLPAPSKHPEILTAEHVSMGLGIDGKSVHALMDRGLMPRSRCPGDDITRIIDRAVFLRWIIEPAHWIYFKPERVGAMRPRGRRGYTSVYDDTFWESARKLVSAARDRWTDEWLTPGQCAHALGLSGRSGLHNINRAISLGNIKATRWGNWRILRSDIPAGMTINAGGRLVEKGSIHPVRCGECGVMGHNKRHCSRRSR